ncbi:aminotransferase-like domain-containing protein [Streptococcus ictaluri]|nr:PLP-dependent aminotransferase family protein [Streptococcus ictaluri]
MTSKYQTIINDITRAINHQELQKGDKLASIRQLSKTYHCSKDTVQKALLQLKYQQLIYAIPKSGYFVLGKLNNESSHEMSLEDYNNMAYEDFRLCLNQALTSRDSYLFHYYHQAQGLEELLVSLKDHLSDTSIYAQKDQLVVTSGSQQALYILSQMPFPNYKEVLLLESPTYHQMESLVSSLNLPYQTIKRDFDGLDFKYLETLFQTGNIKFFYTISRFSNPLGLSYSKKEKERLLALAEAYDVYILEDDYLGDFARHAEPPLHYFDTNNRVIYLKSFSMSVFPAIRIGTLVLPNPLKEAFLKQKSMIDLDTNLLMQKALSLYLANGMFQKNLKVIKSFFERRQELLVMHLFPQIADSTFQISPKEIIIRLDKNSVFYQKWPRQLYQILRHNQQTYLKLDVTNEALFLIWSVQNASGR